MPTEEEVKAAEQARITELNQIVSTHLKQARKGMIEDVSTAVREGFGIKGTFAEAMAEALKAHAVSAPPGGGNDGKGGNDGGSGGGERKPTPQELATQQRLEKLETDLAEARKIAAAEADKAWTERSYAQVQGWLQSRVKPELLDVVTDHVFKRVKKHDDGAPVFSIMKAPFSGAAEEEQRLPLEAGLEEWARGKDAARFLPPPDRTGRRPMQGPNAPRTGANGGREVPTFTGQAKTGQEKTARAIAREAAYAEQFPHLAGR